MPVTMRDVAQKARVSIKTVSRVVNNQGEISEETRQRVLAAIEELGYRPSKVARALVTQRTDTVGLIMADIANPYFSEVARGVLDTAQAKGYDVFLCNSDGNPQQELRLLQSLADHAVDGIIIYPSYDGKDNLTAFAEHYQPLVVINHFVEHPGISLVMLETYQGAKLAVDYLVSKGHTTIGMLTGVSDPYSGKVQRVRGFRDALAAQELCVNSEWIMPCSAPTYECGYEAAQQLLTQHPQLTAIFAYNDLLALGAIQACNDLGCRVPTDCAIVGFDDIQWAAMSTPPLTSVRVDKGNLGRQATSRLLAVLDNPDTVFSPIYVGVELVVRESA